MEKTVNALGRRKSAVARVYVAAGTGNVTINGKELQVYFPDESLQYIVNQPFEVTGTTGQFDIKANLVGGEVDKEAYRSALKTAGFLTRDAREVERKKPGQPGARRRFQFSKR